MLLVVVLVLVLVLVCMQCPAYHTPSVDCQQLGGGMARRCFLLLQVVGLEVLNLRWVVAGIGKVVGSILARVASIGLQVVAESILVGAGSYWVVGIGTAAAAGTVGCSHCSVAGTHHCCRKFLLGPNGQQQQGRTLLALDQSVSRPVGKRR